MSAPAGNHDSGCGCGGVQTQIDAGGNGHGSKDVHGADGGTGQGCQQAGQNAESEDQHEGVDVGAQHLGNGLAHQTGQAGVAQSIGNADDACGHQDDGCADGVADLVEVHNAGDQDDAHGQTGDGVACVADLALQDHAHNGEHKAEVGDELLILGQGNLLLTGVESLFLGLGNGVVRHDLVSQDAPH